MATEPCVGDVVAPAAECPKDCTVPAVECTKDCTAPAAECVKEAAAPSDVPSPDAPTVVDPACTHPCKNALSEAEANLAEPAAKSEETVPDVIPAVEEKATVEATPATEVVLADVAEITTSNADKPAEEAHVTESTVADETKSAEATLPEGSSHSPVGETTPGESAEVCKKSEGNLGSCPEDISITVSNSEEVGKKDDSHAAGGEDSVAKSVESAPVSVAEGGEALVESSPSDSKPVDPPLASDSADSATADPNLKDAVDGSVDSTQANTAASADPTGEAPSTEPSQGEVATSDVLPTSNCNSESASSENHVCENGQQPSSEEVPVKKVPGEVAPDAEVTPLDSSQVPAVDGEKA